MTLLNLWLQVAVCFSFKASIAQSGILGLSLFRFFVDHLSDDTRRLIHRSFRFRVIHFEQIAFCEFRQFSVSFVLQVGRTKRGLSNQRQVFDLAMGAP